mgnify:CR=1 FL=1
MLPGLLLSKKGTSMTMGKEDPKPSLLKRGVLVFAVAVVIVLGIGSLVPTLMDQALESNSNVEAVDVSVDFPGFEDYGGASAKEALKEGEETYLLLPTFDDKDKAIAKAREDAWKSNILTALLMNRLTWKIAMGTVGGFNGDESTLNLLQFFDLYENDESNRELKRTAFREGLSSIDGNLVIYTGQDRYDIGVSE